MRRDPALVPLSHDHHDGLMRAFRLRQAVKAGGEGLDEEVRILCRFHEESLRPHFRAEEEVLFPLLAPLLGEGDRSIPRLLREHRELSGRIAALDPEAGDDGAHDVEALGALATLLDDHIRHEERVLFERCQELITDRAALDALEAELRRVLDRPTDVAACGLPARGGAR